MERKSIPEQLADSLEHQIITGKISGTLPGYLKLSKQLEIGKDTVRAALDILESKGLISVAEPGKRRRILDVEQHKSEKTQTLLIISDFDHKIDAPLKEDLKKLSAVWTKRGGITRHEQTRMDDALHAKRLLSRWHRHHSPHAILVFRPNLAWVEELKQIDTPVFFGGGMVGKYIKEVSGWGVNFKKSINKALDYLESMGHERIMIPDFYSQERLREQIIEIYIERYGNKLNSFEIEQLCPIFKEDHPNVWKSYWASHLSQVHPTAVLCISEALLFSLYGFCSISKISIPTQLSIVTISDAIQQQWIYPQITRLTAPIKAARLFTRWIKLGYPTLGMKLFEFNIIEGSSVSNLTDNETPKL